MDFCASLAPWLNARVAAVTHSPLRTGSSVRRRARRISLHASAPRSAHASAPKTGEIARPTRIPTTPVGWPSVNPPQWTPLVPAATRDAPTSPPTRACDELDGSPNHHVSRFHAIAAVTAAPTAVTVASAGNSTTPPTVSATAVPTSSGPAKFPAAARISACPGRAARVATSAAIEFAESWKPLVRSNANVSRSPGAGQPPSFSPRGKRRWVRIAVEVQGIEACR